MVYNFQRTFLHGVKDMRKFFWTIFFSGLMISASFPIWANGSLILFSTEEAAQKHCPDDEVVWLNLCKNVWHRKGGAWYAKTVRGQYVCRNEMENFDGAEFKPSYY